MKLLNRSLVTGMGALLLGLTSASSIAAPLGFWATDGWTALAIATPGEDGQVGPGVGGQQFDAEYLYFKQSGNTLSLGLQAGFNLITGYEYHSTNPKDYYAGDLALSFDGSVGPGSAGFEYAVDFGLLTKDYQKDLVDMGSGTGVDPAGFYSVSAWNNDVYSGHTIANPFAADSGTLVSALISNVAGSGIAGGQTSYFRTVSFDISSLNLTGNSTLNAHWTMSCGNDYIDGTTTLTSVPEPSAMVLMLMSLLGLGWVGRRKRVAA